VGGLAMARADWYKLAWSPRSNWGRGDFDDFLMAALHGAIPFEEMDDVALAVSQKLDFDVPGPLHVFFQKNVGIAEGGAGLALGLVQGVIELVGRQGDAHAAAATPMAA